MIISAVLLPSAKDSKELVEWSGAINDTVPSLIQLGKDVLPHITVVQFKAPESAAMDLWKVVQPLSDSVTELTSGGLVYVPDIRRNQLWVELQFLKSQVLSTLQEEILQSPFAKQYLLHNGRGDHYHPHCTLALIDGLATPELNLSLHRSIFKREFSGLRLTVGVNGDNFTFPGAL